MAGQMMRYDNGEDEYKERGSLGESWAVETVVGVAGLQDSVWGVARSVPECCWGGWGVLGESSRLPTEMPESVLWLRPLAVHGSSSGSASSSSCSHWSSDSCKGNDRHSHGSTACKCRRWWWWWWFTEVIKLQNTGVYYMHSYSLTM